MVQVLVLVPVLVLALELVLVKEPVIRAWLLVLVLVQGLVEVQTRV